MKRNDVKIDRRACTTNVQQGEKGKRVYKKDNTSRIFSFDE